MGKGIIYLWCKSLIIIFIVNDFFYAYINNRKPT